MEGKVFTFTRKSLHDYGSKHAYAQMMFCSAGDDYAAARCLTLNHLMESGFPLFSQSVEKFLKAVIYLETGEKPTIKGRDRHNPYALKQELQRAADYGLDKYDAIFQKLYGHFQHRYFDNKDKSGGMGGDELVGFDELWMYLFERVPFPVEVKYRLRFPAMVFEPDVLKWLPNYRHWVIYENFAIASKLPEMEATYFAVKQHYLESKE
jgi:hypothetical protein